MKNIKIRIPNKEVSKLVQEKAFREGFGWYLNECEKKLRLTREKFLFLGDCSDTDITYCESEGYFNRHENKEISWQEYLYGEGYFFKCFGENFLYFQAKKDNRVYWLFGDKVGSEEMLWKQGMKYNAWELCDMFGNLIEEKKDMKKSDLVAGKHVVEVLSGYKYFVMDNYLLSFSGGWNELSYLREDLTDSEDQGYTIVKVYEHIPVGGRFYPKGEEFLKLVWEREAPVEEMTMEEVCKALGKNVKIVKDKKV